MNQPKSIHPHTPSGHQFIDDMLPPRSAARRPTTAIKIPPVRKVIPRRAPPSLREHVTRMINTAGHSWATYEHDELTAPLRRFSKKILGLLPASIRQSQFLPGRSRWWQTSYFILLFAALLAIPLGLVIRNDLRTQRYVLSADVQKLVGNPVPVLDKQITFSQKTHAYQYNPNAVNGIKPPTNSAGDNGLAIGGSKYYGVDLAAAANKGQTFTDAQTKLSFSLTPQFGALDGKHIDGHVVYPIDNGQVVYTLKSNGLKEDVVLSTPTDSVNLRYKLQLPTDLEAKLLPDGSVGIYSADPSLFGNITYGSDKDQASVQKARTNGAKNNLVFQIPAPVVTESGKAKGTGMAKFSLKDNELTVTARNLSDLHYPISIDPSVVVSSANSFSSGNAEDNSTDTSGGNLTRIPLSGATLGSGWTNAGGTSFTTARFDLGSVVLNGYAYVAGGNTGAAQVNTVFYASITGPGTIGAWSPANATTDAKDYKISMVAYDGFLYMLAGNQDSNQAVTNVWYAAQCTGSNVTTSFTSNCAVGSPAGSISSWKSTTNLTTGRIFQSAAVYNGYVYVIGGCVSATGAGCVANTGIIGNLEYAKINADGSLSSWTTSANAALARYGQQSAVYNGNLYVMGGCTLLASSNCSGSATNDAWFAPLNPSTGAPGTWVQTNVPPAGGGVRMGGVATTYDGYMYVVGGCNNAGSAPSCNAQTPLSTSSYAPIYANGQLGPWSNTTALSTPLRDQAGFEYGGYLYMLGGCTTSALNCSSGGGGSNTSTSAKIDSPGPVGTYQTETDTIETDGIFGGTSVAYGGYLYILGGSNAIAVGSAVSTVYYTQLNADGSTGAWATTSPFNQARNGAAVVTYNGYMYIMGGWHNAVDTACSATSSQYCGDVQKAVINSDGTLQAWTSAGGNYSTTARGYLGGAVYNGYLYVIGGVWNNNSNLSAETDVGQIQSTGNVSGWTTTGNLNRTSSDFAVAQAGQYVYVLGGRTSAGSFDNYIEYATLSNSGTVTWASANNFFANVRTDFTAGASNGFVYINGGAFGAGNNVYSDTQYARVCIDAALTDGCNGTAGTLGTWHTTSTFTTGRMQHMGAIYNGYLYVMGGCSNQGFLGNCASSADLLNDLQYAPLNNGGGGSVVNWATNGTSITARYFHGSLAYNGFMYVLGGSGSSGSYLNSVQYAPFNADGSIGTWNPTSAFNNTSSGSGYAAYNGYIYKIGGRANSVYQSDVQYAAVCTGKNTTTAFTTQCTTSSTPGTLSSWNYTANNTFNTSTQTGGMSTVRGGMGAAAYGGYLYAFGGCNSNHSLPTYCNGLLNTIEYAPINANGTIGSWTVDGNNFTTGRNDFAYTSYNGYLYIAGGCTLDGGSNCTTYTTDVQYAKLGGGALASNAGCGTAWCFAPNYMTIRESPSLAAGNGYLYLTGGKEFGGFANDVQIAPILSTGAIGIWTTASSKFSTAREGHASLVYNGRLYINGGCGNSLAPCNPVQTDVQYGSLQSITRIAHYSRMIDLKSTVGASLGGDPQVTRYALKGTGPTTYEGLSGVSFCASTATNSAALFGTPICATGIALGNLYGAKGIGRYAFVFVTVDDSQTATYPDANVTNISELDAFFHASPQRRLRGGQTFIDTNGATSNQLDTEGP